MQDPYNLHRFVQAQNPVINQVLAELRAGSKRSHWMWFVFPQIAGLGHSEMARRYAISSIREAQAYADHPVLGERLRTCTELVNGVASRSAEQIFGYPDVMKFHSSMTLFSCARPDDEAFGRALALFYEGQRDQATLDRLRMSPHPADAGQDLPRQV